MGWALNQTLKPLAVSIVRRRSVRLLPKDQSDGRDLARQSETGQRRFHSFGEQSGVQIRKREAKGLSAGAVRSKSYAPAMCGVCCAAIKPGNKYCKVCAPIASRENLIESAKDGRVATVSPKAQALRSATQKRQAAALKAWNPADKPDWLDEKTYRERIQPKLASVTVPTIVSALDVSEPYATNIRAGRCIPHPRHWLALSDLAGLTLQDTHSYSQT